MDRRARLHKAPLKRWQEGGCGKVWAMELPCKLGGKFHFEGHFENYMRRFWLGNKNTAVSTKRRGRMSPISLFINQAQFQWWLLPCIWLNVKGWLGKRGRKENQSQKSFHLISFIGNNHKRSLFPRLMKNSIDLEVGRCDGSEVERATWETCKLSPAVRAVFLGASRQLKGTGFITS